MISEVERLSREVEALRARVEAFEWRAVPIERVSARERRLLMRRLAEVEAGDSLEGGQGQPRGEAQVTGFRVEFTRRARRDLDRAPQWLVGCVVALVSVLEENPIQRVGWNVRELSGMGGIYRVRVGDYRIVYVTDDFNSVVTVLRVTSRGDTYAD